MLELLVTMAVASILLAIAVPALSMFIQNNREDAEADALISSLDYARSEAVKRNVDIQVCASDTGAACSGATAWNGGWIVATTDPTPIVLQVKDPLGGGNTLSGTLGLGGTAISEVTFEPNGFDKDGIANQYATTYFTLCDSRGATDARDIEISPVGAIQASPTPGQTLDDPPNPLTCP